MKKSKSIGPIIAIAVTTGVGNTAVNAIGKIEVLVGADLTPAVNGTAVKFTTGALTTGANNTQQITLTNTSIAAADTVRASIAAYTGTGGIPVLYVKSNSLNTAVLELSNGGNSAFDGDFTIFVEVIKAIS